MILLLLNQDNQGKTPPHLPPTNLNPKEPGKLAWIIIVRCDIMVECFVFI